MKPWSTLASARTPDGAALTLEQRGEELAIRAGGQLLMSSRSHGSEELLAKAALDGREREVLVGGLGMGFTLRAALDRLATSAKVCVAELFAEVVAWNRGPLAGLAGAPLDDPRVRVHLGDVRAALGAKSFDAILLDVDNGPTALTQKSNAALYGSKGLAALHAALRPNGKLGLWSGAPAPEFAARLKRVGFAVEVRPAGGRHVIFLATRRRG